MSHGKRLNELEIGKILAFLESNMPISEIAGKMGRSRKVVYNLIRKKNVYDVLKLPGRPKVLSPRKRNAIIKFARGKCITANEIKSRFELKTSKNTILKVLNNSNC